MKNADFTSSKPPKRPPSAKEVPDRKTDGIVSSEISRGRKTEESRKVDLGGACLKYSDSASRNQGCRSLRCAVSKFQRASVVKKEQSRVHDFVFRGLLSEEAVDRAGRSTRVSFDGPGEAEIERILSITSLPDDLVQQAKTMSAVYVAVAAFENSVRELILGVLLEAIGEDWWTSAISQKVSDRAEKRKADEDKIKWHTNRRMHQLYYTTMADLVNVIRNNWEH